MDDIRIRCTVYAFDAQTPPPDPTCLRTILDAVCAPETAPRRFGLEVRGALVPVALAACDVALRRARFGVDVRTDLVFQPQENATLGFDLLAKMRSVAMLPNCFVVIPVDCPEFSYLYRNRFAGRTDQSLNPNWGE